MVPTIAKEGVDSIRGKRCVECGCGYVTLPTHLSRPGTIRQKVNPFVFGFTVYQSFESDSVASSGIAPLPDSSETALGGHAVMAVGYDDASSRLLARNSWGTGWGMGGYFTLPYAYVADNNLADDFWTIRLVK
jgi:C1A family cysteine protease